MFVHRVSSPQRSIITGRRDVSTPWRVVVYVLGLVRGFSVPSVGFALVVLSAVEFVACILTPIVRTLTRPAAGRNTVSGTGRW